MSVVTLSMEVELGWGVHDVDEYERISHRREAETTYLRRLLEHCDRVGVPFSFDVVGHLLRESCDADHESPHEAGWFDADPGTDVDDDPLFYAPDLVEDIRATDVDHELCTHSFSHVACEHTSTEAVEWDLRKAQAVHEDVLGERTVSFVPPKHERPPVEALRAAGIEIIRMHRSENLSPPAKLMRMTLGPHPAFEPELVDGIVVSYCTTYPSLTSSLLPSGQQRVHPAFRYLPLSLDHRSDLHARYLRRAAEAALESGTPVHLWTHLNDLANEHQWAAVRRFLTELARLEAATDLEVVTMADLNDRVRADAAREGTDDEDDEVVARV